MAPAPEPLSRQDLIRILGLTGEEPVAGVRAAASRLLGVLRSRRDRMLRRHTEDDPDPARDDRLRRLEEEIAQLEAALARWAPGSPAGQRTTARGPRPRSEAAAARVDRNSLAGAMLGSALMLVLLIAYASGFRIERIERDGFAAQRAEPARLVLAGRLPGATLRILDADREELLVETPAEGASVELAEGRYALVVSREDCPDEWTRSHYFEAGATHRFEPLVCVGEGRLALTTNPSVDRLQIDGFDLDPDQVEPYRLGVGDHSLRLEKEGYETYEAQIRIEPDAELALRAELIAESKSTRTPPRQRPPGITPPRFDQPDPVKPVPFDLGDLTQKLAPEKLRAEPSRLLLRRGLAGLETGGSTAWHDRVSAELLSRFDGDGSGLIDRLEESDGIPCVLWREIERDFERGGLGLSMARYYGFDGSEWHDRALGFARGMRSAAYVKMKECGLTD